MKRRLITILAVLGLLVAGCAPPGGGAATTSSAPTASPAATSSSAPARSYDPYDY